MTFKIIASPTKGEGEQEEFSPLSRSGRWAGGEGVQSREGEQERWEISAELKERMTDVARQLRRKQTKSEEILWQAIRAAKLEGRKFRRQQPIGSFVVDFFCAAERLIVEVDGGIHDSQKELDQQRQALLESLGLRFVRFSAEQVENNLALCLEQIESAFLPSPLSGRGAGGEGRKGKEATVIAWLWARTVKCPNPACGCQMPLVRSFQLSTKKGKEAWVEPVIDRTQSPPIITFGVKTGKGKAPEGTVNRKGATCIACESPVPFDHVRSEGKAGRMDAQLMAIVAEGQRERVYLSPDEEHERIAKKAQPQWKPDSDLPEQALGFRVQGYGMTKHSDLFTPRQLVALTTFSDRVSEAREKVKADAVVAGMVDDGLPLNDGGTGATAYADAIAIYLSLCLGRIADFGTTISTWNTVEVSVRNTFSRQAIPMSWDYAEANPMGRTGGGHLEGAIERLVNALIFLNPNGSSGKCEQKDAPSISRTEQFLISTDPPYYDNIGYADLSDFFYIWLRRSLQSIYLDLFTTLLVPKTQELVATPYRFDGSKQKARTFFEEGLGKSFNQMHEISYAAYPLTVYYAFKQAETDSKGKDNESVASTGWETMLEGLIKADFSICGTWPVRTEFSSRSIASGTNALASSIVLVCRPRPTDAPKATRRQFLNELKRDLPQALKLLQQGNIAPVDLAQASIGPGMAIFSKYTAVLEADGSAMRVRTALQLINQILDEFLTEQEGEFDSDTRWALTWFEQHQFTEGQYGDAETLSKAKNTSVQGMKEAGILEAKAGKVRLLKREDLKSDWKPESDTRIPVWEVTQHLIRTLDQDGETGAAELSFQIGK